MGWKQQGDRAMFSRRKTLRARVRHGRCCRLHCMRHWPIKTRSFDSGKW